MRAPNHKLTQPWRFAVLTGGAVARFAEMRARHRLQRFADPESPEARAAADKMRRETGETPVIVIVMCRVSPDEITREEDYAATMMAIANLMIAAESLGLGTYLRTGGIMQHPALAELVHLPAGYRIVGIVSVGYLSAAPEPTPRRHAPAELTQWLD